MGNRHPDRTLGSMINREHLIFSFSASVFAFPGPIRNDRVFRALRHGFVLFERSFTLSLHWIRLPWDV